MQREFYKTRLAGNFRLEYYIIRNKITNKKMDVLTYGIEIIKRQSKNEMTIAEAKTVKNICISESSIYRLAELLFENSVTPITLRDILDDLLAENKIVLPCEQAQLNELFV